MEDYFLSIKEFAKRLSVHPSTIRRAIKKCKISGVNMGTEKRKCYRIPLSEINRMAMIDLKELIEKSDGFL